MKTKDDIGIVGAHSRAAHAIGHGGDSDGFVYFIACLSDPPAIKVGVARRPMARLNHMQTSNPFRLALIAVVRGGFELEKTIHRDLAPWRVRGEWYLHCERMSEWMRMAYKTVRIGEQSMAGKKIMAHPIIDRVSVGEYRLMDRFLNIHYGTYATEFLAKAAKKEFSRKPMGEAWVMRTGQQFTESNFA